MKTILLRYSILIFFVIPLFLGCKKENYDESYPPAPPVELSFINAGESSIRQGGISFLIPNPGLNGNLEFNALIKANDGRLVDKIEVYYQYTRVTKNGNGVTSGTFGAVLLETVVINAVTPVTNFNYVVSIADLNNSYFDGFSVLTTGNWFDQASVNIVRDQNEFRIKVFFKDGSIIALGNNNPIAIFYPVKEDGIE